MPPSPALAPAWSVVGSSPRTTELELIFAVKQTNIEKLHDTLMEVSTPTSPKYGQHLTNDQVHALVAPAPADLAAVETCTPQPAP